MRLPMPTMPAGAITLQGGSSARQLDAIAGFVRGVGERGGDLFGEVFRYGHPTFNSALLGATDAGAGVKILADAKEGAAALQEVSRRGASIVRYATQGSQAATGYPFVLHTKLWAARDRAVLSTVSPIALGLPQHNVTAMLNGAPALAVRDAIVGARTGDLVQSAAAVEQARAAGVLFNDPLLGVRHIDDAYGALIDGAEHDLRIVMKEFVEPAWAERVVAARKRGVNVDLTVRSIDKGVERALKKGGIKVKHLRFSGVPGSSHHERLDPFIYRRIHYNSIEADHQYGVLWSRYLWEPPAGKPSARLAREAGFIVGPDNYRALESVITDHLNRPFWRDFIGA